jgi:Flp pilus assembly protein TadG
MNMNGLSGLRRLTRTVDDRGNVAIIAALSMVPICLAGLGAADLARGAAARVQLQDALDAAALAAARQGSGDAMTTVGRRYLSQNLTLTDDYRLVSSSFQETDDGKVVATARLELDPFLGGLMSGSMPVEVSTEVVRAAMKVEIALVLDTTGSMNEGAKLADMKKAAKTFVTNMEDVAQKSIEPNSVKISLVPFANAVRVDGTAYRNSTWMDQNGDAPINDQIFTTDIGTLHAKRFDLFTTIGTSWRGCVEMRQAPYDVQDTPPNTGMPATLYTPFFAVDEPDSKTNGYSDDYKNSYLADGVANGSSWKVRQGAIAKYKKKTGLGTTLGPNAGCGTSKVMRLTTNFSSLRTAIDGLVADGNTNIPVGMAWGWNTLSPDAPFNDGVAYGADKYKKIVVLMTDGENTMSLGKMSSGKSQDLDTPNDGAYAATGYIWQKRVLKANGQPLNSGASASDRTAALDSRLALLCTNMKAKDIEVYTIRVEVTTGTSTLLQTCATSRDHYYDVKSSTTLTTVFQSIAGQIAALHLSK